MTCLLAQPCQWRLAFCKYADIDLHAGTHTISGTTSGGDVGLSDTPDHTAAQALAALRAGSTAPGTSNQAAL